jgi:hypothetical protein
MTLSINNTYSWFTFLYINNSASVFIIILSIALLNGDLLSVILLTVVVLKVLQPPLKKLLLSFFKIFRGIFFFFFFWSKEVTSNPRKGDSPPMKFYPPTKISLCILAVVPKHLFE